MSTSTSYEFDDKNQADFLENTEKINKALKIIENDKALSATLAELERQSGLHRNTLRNRTLTVGDLQIETTVSDELKRIKRNKKLKKEQDKSDKKDLVKELENQLDHAKDELVYWFTKFQTLSQEAGQLDTQLSRKTDLVDWYKKELEKERSKVRFLEDRINILEELNK
ncbi:hypothetical protein ATY74_002789 [Vibrio parahaemolyticus]|uniref:hypothetical protein n=1 Tax=Vibrio parahaemolyticus TaxID=670 RepID=UPI00100FE6F4|nr:hypothetical protein [Vibrio parahaemolyticus]EJE4704626.1 hypothetical protein [Vibrio parahaemolyticus]RXQ03317.1 hypothetical protein EGL69_13680 [Vibrio parahaemolyticus]HCG5639565.1 hypothetical protein [Vibrio parahaemolyticus]HCM0779615.1 hypothetical protein [Vibrio parahaemolyticus]